MSVWLSDGLTPWSAADERNFDMEESGRDKAQLPSEGHEDDFVGKWIHSDIKNVALPYVSKMYKTLINEGKLSNSQ